MENPCQCAATSPGGNIELRQELIYGDIPPISITRLQNEEHAFPAIVSEPRTKSTQTISAGECYVQKEEKTN